jgi:hypothetical protein
VTLEHRQSRKWVFSRLGLGANTDHRLFVGWVEHRDIFCWVSFLYPTYYLVKKTFPNYEYSWSVF